MSAFGGKADITPPRTMSANDPKRTSSACYDLMCPDWCYESGPMPQSALKKIAALRRCGGLLSRLAYERGLKEGADVDVFLQQARLTSRQIKNEDIQLGVQNQIKFIELVANATGDPLLGFHLAYSYDLREIGLLYYVIASAETLFLARC